MGESDRVRDPSLAASEDLLSKNTINGITTEYALLAEKSHKVREIEDEIEEIDFSADDFLGIYRKCQKIYAEILEEFVQDRVSDNQKDYLQQAIFLKARRINLVERFRTLMDTYNWDGIENHKNLTNFYQEIKEGVNFFSQRSYFRSDIKTRLLEILDIKKAEVAAARDAKAQITVTRKRVSRKAKKIR